MYNDDLPFLGRDSFRSEKQEEAVVEDTTLTGRARIRVIGVGGAGNNAVNRMVEAGIKSADYVAVNTDAQILACSKAQKRIQIGSHLTKGLGAGADPEIGKNAAEESKEELVKAVENTDLLFITAGMGGGTGTGAAPVIAKIAKDKKILTVAVVTEPFSFEGRHRKENAMVGIETLKKNVDTIIIIPNEKIGDVAPKNATMEEALRVADDVLKQGIRGIADLIVTPSLINLDFADVRTILKDKGLAHMGVGVAKGENRIVEAVRLAVNCPLLDTTIEGATGVILNVVGGPDLTYEEVRLAARLIHSVVDYSANIIFGACIDENISDEVEVTVIATGFPSGDKAAQDPSRGNVRNAPQAPQRPVNPTGFSGGLRPMQPQAPNQPNPNTPHGGYNASAQPNAYGAAQPQQGYTQPVPPVQPNVNAPQNGYNAPAQPNAYGAAQPQQGYTQPASPIINTPQNGYNAPAQPNAYGAAQPQQGYTQPVSPIINTPQNGYNAPAQPNAYGAAQPQQGGYAQPVQPVSNAPQGYAPMQDEPVYTDHQTEDTAEEDDYSANPRDQKLPPFVQRLLGKKKK